MKRSPLPPLLLVIVFAISGQGLIPFLPAQDDLAAEAEEKAKSVLSDPRFRNALRSVKQDPEAALDKARQDPDEAVREATRIFQEKTQGIDLDQIKAAAAKAQADGTIDRAMDKISEAEGNGTLDKAREQISAAIPKPAAAPAPATVAAPVAATSPSTASPTTTTVPAVAGNPETPVASPPASTPAPVVAPAPAAPVVEVPATRPAPGISGGDPTPVAMPLDPALAAVPVADSPSVRASTVPESAAPPAAVAKVEVIPGAAPTTPRIPDSPSLLSDKVPDPVPLSKKYQRDAGGGYPAAKRTHMEIRSKESIMDNPRGVLLFTGDVLIDHPEFEIKCDKLEIQLAEGVGMNAEGSGTGENFKRAIASGGMVEIKRVSTDEKGKRKTQIAIARSADYNAVTKDIILSGGPPYIQDGESFVRTTSEDAKIIMRGNGKYEITGTMNRHTISIPIENKPGDGKGKGKGGIGTGLEGTFNNFR